MNYHSHKPLLGLWEWLGLKVLRRSNLKYLENTRFLVCFPEIIYLSLCFCRHWQDSGFMIIYVTGRPDMQKHRVVAWLTQHNFPHGIVSFCDGLTHDPLRQKAAFLQGLQQEVCTRLCSCTTGRDIQWRFYSGVTEGACGKSWRSTTGEREVREQWC